MVVRAAADLAPSGADLEAATALQEAGVGLVLLSPSLTDSWVVVAPQRGIEWGDDHAAELAAATVSNKPTIVDFTADWCAACKELEHFTYTDPAVVRCSDEFETVMFDATRESPEFLDLKDHYGIQGLPAVFFVCPDGEVIDDLTLKGFEAADRFLEKMNIALNTCGRG